MLEMKFNSTHGYLSTVACRCLALLTRPERTSSNLGWRCALSRWFDEIASRQLFHVKLLSDYNLCSQDTQ